MWETNSFSLRSLFPPPTASWRLGPDCRNPKRVRTGVTEQAPPSMQQQDGGERAARRGGRGRFLAVSLGPFQLALRLRDVARSPSDNQTQSPLGTSHRRGAPDNHSPQPHKAGPGSPRVCHATRPGPASPSSQAAHACPPWQDSAWPGRPTPPHRTDSSVFSFREAARTSLPYSALRGSDNHPETPSVPAASGDVRHKRGRSRKDVTTPPLG